MKVMIAENVWRGDHNAYSARFADIVAKGVSIAPDLLAGYYLSNLPVEIYREITRGGTRKFEDWQEAAAALATTAPPWTESCEERLRFQRDLECTKVATGPTSIPVSPDWGKNLFGREVQVNAEGQDMGENQQPLAVQSHTGTKLLVEEEHMRKRDHSSDLEGVAAERNCQRDTSTEEPQCWREHGAQEDTTSNGTVCSVGMTAILRVEVAGSQCEALLDTGASRSFISPGAVERLQLKVRRLPEECVFTVANGAQLRIDHVVKGLTMWCGATRLAGDFLIGPVPYDLVVGLDWLTNHRVAWYFQSDKLRTYVNGQWCDLPVVRANDVKQRKGSTQGMRQRTPAEQTYDILAKQVAHMTREEATALLRPPFKRYKLPSKRKRKAVVAALIQQATESTACISHPLQGLYAILVLPAMESYVALRLVEERQGALCYAMVEASSPNLQQQCLKAPLPPALPDDEEISPWSTAKLEYSQFDTWLTSAEAQATPRAILDVLCAHRAVFPDKLPTGLPPKRPHDHRILLVPEKLPTKSAIYRMTPEQLQLHKQEIAKLSPSPSLQQVLRIFLDQQFYPKFSKCRFAKLELTYLGYTISAAGIKPAADKIQAIKAWPEVFENETQICQFRGTVNYCRMFMDPDFAEVARPLVDLTRKGTPFQWTDTHTQAVRRLKQRLIDYTTLQLPDTTKPFELYTDASGYAIGAVLEQAGQPIGFLSQAMTPTQQKYSIYDQELLALVAVLDKWAHLLGATKVTAHTDHEGLTHLQQLKASKPLRGRTARWLDFLAEFPDLTITYLPSTRNQIADALSRLPCYRTPCPQPSPIALPGSPPGSLAVLAPATDPSDPPHKTRGTRTDYRQLAGLRRRSSRKCPPSQPVSHPPTAPNPAPESPTLTEPQQTSTSPVLDWPAAYSKCPVFSEPHHTASTKPGEVVQLEFEHRRHTFRFVLPCLHICVMVSRSSAFLNFQSSSLMSYTRIMITPQQGIEARRRPIQPSASINIGLACVLTPTPRWPTLFKKSHSAVDTVELLADRLIRYHGFPDVLVSDRDPRFQSEVWSQLCSRFNITRAMSSSYNPQTDGQTERVNRTLEQMLRTYIQADEREWEGLLPALELACNTASHSSTALSPFEIMIGENPLTAADLDIVGALTPTLTPPMSKLFRQLCD
ncbi:hypothetical protein EBH_0071610 [Eimeria brunetti]|uniref:RNA-directed DNA polymerase n=1 Tax=Eimeria brunetti TaxID=51314 RepID=U6L9V7_9EIME|nr:hypothetical protein EBH_0071610 [Eimeria brunetti]